MASGDLMQRVAKGVSRRLRGQAFNVLGKLSSTLSTRTPQGVLTVYSKDHGLGRELFINREFELDLSQRVVAWMDSQRRSRVGGVVLDVGANVGVISIGMLHAGHFERAVAVEPAPETFALLERNVRQNGLADRLRCIRAAAAETIGELQFELSDRNYGDHRVRGSANSTASKLYDNATRRQITVPAVPIDQVLAELPQEFTDAVRLVWIDIQGYEQYAFAGSPRLFSRDVPVVAEVWPYGMRICGIDFDDYCSVAARYWRSFWVYRHGRFFRYDIAHLRTFLDEVDVGSVRDNVIFTQE